MVYDFNIYNFVLRNIKRYLRRFINMCYCINLMVMFYLSKEILKQRKISELEN